MVNVFLSGSFNNFLNRLFFNELCKFFKLFVRFGFLIIINGWIIKIFKLKFCLNRIKLFVN